MENRLDGQRRTFTAAHILAATGRRANTGGLGLDVVGIATDKLGFVRVDPTLRTTHPRFYAAGDVTGPPMLVYLAAAQGKQAADNALLAQSVPLDVGIIPYCCFH